eukprot:TRINITY_DN17064_c0_g1_i1.p1 TRINITY_DN17064_c0_g1~~TRINITY_DN17064_c0_g1_i1.p1  ORF type:complete len:361 (-),score=109.35 TRINITY_DN17064_c0_g1_i1:149-1231(-)
MKATFGRNTGFSALPEEVQGMGDPTTPLTDGKRKDPRTVKRKTPDVTPMVLCSDSGLQDLMEQMKQLGPRLSGKRGSEKKELDMVLRKFTGWAKELRPHMHFDTFTAKCERLSGNSTVQNHLASMRNQSSAHEFASFLDEHERAMYGEQEEGEANQPADKPNIEITQEMKDKSAQSRLRALRIREEKAAARRKAEQESPEDLIAAAMEAERQQQEAMMQEEEDMLAMEEEMMSQAQEITQGRVETAPPATGTQVLADTQPIEVPDETQVPADTQAMGTQEMASTQLLGTQLLPDSPEVPADTQEIATQATQITETQEMMTQGPLETEGQEEVEQTQVVPPTQEEHDAATQPHEIGGDCDL